MATVLPLTNPSSTSADKGISDKTLSGLGSLLRLLPTGTVFFYQFLNPILTKNGDCSTTNKYVSIVVLALCGLSCFFSKFTDSYEDDQGKTHYGIPTFTGFWPTSPSDGSTASSVDFKSYRIQIGDFAHAFLSLIVFYALSLLDTNTIRCLYPSSETTLKALLMSLTPIIGVSCGCSFCCLPRQTP